MGRKRKNGLRTSKSNRLSRAKTAQWDYGNERMVELEQRFAPFQDGKAGQWIKSPIGRAWAVGLLDGFDVDAAALRDAGLGYAERYWMHWSATGPGTNCVSGYGGASGRSTPSDRAVANRERLFNALDRAVSDCGHRSRAAVQELVVDCHWFPTDDPPWLGRLINERLVRARRGVAGELPRLGDRERLELAIHGLLAIAAGSERRRAA
jgi:hypothetical protein